MFHLPDAPAGAPVKYCTGRKHIESSICARRVERAMPPPIGVVTGFDADEVFLNASTVSSAAVVEF